MKNFLVALNPPPRSEQGEGAKKLVRHQPMYMIYSGLHPIPAPRRKLILSGSYNLITYDVGPAHLVPKFSWQVNKILQSQENLDTYLLKYIHC